MATRKKAAPKRGASRYKAPAKKPVPGWVWLACGLLVGGFIMFLMQLQPGRDGIKRDKTEQATTASKATLASLAVCRPNHSLHPPKGSLRVIHNKAVMLNTIMVRTSSLRQRPTDGMSTPAG